MITYKKQKYDDIRTSIPDDVFVTLIQETLKVNGVEIEKSVARRVLASLLSSMAYYFYSNPEFFVDFKKMVLYRDIKLNNLLVLESKDGESAEDIFEYYRKGGSYSEELSDLIKAFVKGLLNYSVNKEKELSEEINKIQEVKRSRERKDNNSKKKGEN